MLGQTVPEALPSDTLEAMDPSCRSLADGPGATVIVVAYRTPSLSLDWVPPDAPVIVVHNDGSLDPERVTRSGTQHIGDRTNIGFGAGVNLALPLVATDRVVLTNPDTELKPEHWEALAHGADDEIVVVPLVDGLGHRTSVVNRYPTPATVLLTALRVGRLVPRHSLARYLLSPVLGRWGAEHRRSLQRMDRERRFPAGTHWPSAAVCSYPTELLRRAGGFDPGYFLYLEDIDLSRRMAAITPHLIIRQIATTPGTHQVSASSASPAGRRQADIEQARSALRYASSEPGVRWLCAATVLRLVVRWRAR